MLIYKFIVLFLGPARIHLHYLVFKKHYFLILYIAAEAFFTICMKHSGPYHTQNWATGGKCFLQVSARHSYNFHVLHHVV